MFKLSQLATSWRPWARSAVLVGAALSSGFIHAQKIDDVPPAVRNNVAPNFMFMIDNSGSMSNIVPAAPFVPETTYLASCSGASLIAAGSAVTINISSSNVPRFNVGGNTYRHTTAPASGADPDDRRCFDPSATYSARLLGEPRTPTSGYLPSEYTGNFLNWYFGTYTAHGSHPLTGWTGGRKAVSSGVVQTRIEVARQAATDVVNNVLLLPPVAGASAPVRVGLTTYRSGDGGSLRVPITDLTATSRPIMNAAIAALTPSGNTPLASTLADIGRYFSSGWDGAVSAGDVKDVNVVDFLRQDGRQSCLSLTGGSCTSQAAATFTQQPVQYWCQRSSVFMMTDGRPTADNVFQNNTYLRDYDRDCSGSNAGNCSSGGGFDRKNASLRTYEQASSSDYMDDVAKALFDVDLRPDLIKPAAVAPATAAKNNLTTYVIGFADPAVANDPLLRSTGSQGGGDFIAASDGPKLVEAFRDVITDALAKDASAAAVSVTNAQITLDSIGYASSYNSGSWFGDLEAYSLSTSSGLQSGPVQWSARDRLNARSPSSRRIASFNGTTGAAFTTANGGAFRVGAPTLTDGIINFVRGDRTGEGSTYRTRAHLLGDIVNAEPVVVNYPGTGATVFQAANDGMLHVFDGRVVTTATTRGEELWAYVPRLIHDKLAGLASTTFEHKYLVDGTPATAEITGAGDMTRILVGGLGKGGAGYYALDITTGTAADEAAAVSKVKFEFKPANMGYSFGTPLIVKTAAGWRVVVASGYRNDTASGGLGGDGRGHVWVLDPADGSVVKQFTTPSGFGSSTDPLGLAHLGKLANTTPDAIVRFVYGGDLKGNVWRFDLDATSGSQPVRIATLTDGSGNFQPVAAPPVVGPVTGSSSKLYVYVGTGRYLSDDDVPGTATPNDWATQTQTMYGIADDTSVPTPPLPNIRRDNGTTCPTGGGNGDFVCQVASRASISSPFTATANAVDLSTKRGFYMDIPITNGRSNNMPALTVKGTLVFVVNEPTNTTCNPGGNSFFFQLDASTGGAVPRIAGGNTYFNAGFALANALSSRAVIITTSTGTKGLFRLSDKTTQSRDIDESKVSNAAFKRIYKRALN